MDRNVSMIFLQYILYAIMCYVIGVCAQNCQSRPMNDIQRLQNDVFCNYDKTVTPKKTNNTNTDVAINFILKQFYFYTYVDVLNVRFFTIMSWRDSKLSWNRASYGGIGLIHPDSTLIWMPEIAMTSPYGIHEGQMDATRPHCILVSSGMIQCILAHSFSIPCSADITRWPYDSQSCGTLIKPWTRSTDDFTYSIQGGYNGNLLTDDVFSKQWDLQEAKFVKMTTWFENTTYSYTEMVMQMKRHGNLYEATTVLPGLVLALATLVSFWMDSEINVRFCLCSTAIVMDSMYLLYVGYLLDYNGASCPLIVLFYRDHLLTSTAALLITFIVRWMYGTELQVPILATSIVHPIFNSRSASWLLLAEPTTDEVQQKKQQWQPLALILDRVSFAAFSITFLILYFICF